MRLFSVFAMFLATPALAHPAAITHSHAEWAVPLGMALIAVAGVSAAWVRVRR